MGVHQLPEIGGQKVFLNSFRNLFTVIYIFSKKASRIKVTQATHFSKEN